ncbi:MAG: PKD domain-containing protein [Syntrophobacteraceae bacterium]
MSHRHGPTRFLCLLLIVTGLLLLSGLYAGAATINVPADYPTIQAGIDAAVDGDTVLVDPGTYVEAINFAGKAITVASSAGPEVTTIDANGQGPVVTDYDCGARLCALRGFTLHNGAGYFGTAVSMPYCSPIISGNVVEGGASPVDEAVFVADSDSTVIENNIFRDFTCNNNYSYAGVISLQTWGGNPVIRNNLFYNNQCVAINFSQGLTNDPQVTNNTIVGNSVGIGVNDVFAVSGGIGPWFKNNMIVGNGTGFQVTVEPWYTYEAFPPQQWQNNLVYGNGANYLTVPDQTGAYGNISADPLFADISGNDFHLNAGSPAIGAGDANSISLDAADFDGNPRVIGGRLDIGAYEYDPDAPPRVSFTLDKFSGAAPLEVDFTSHAVGTVTAYEWDFGDGSTSSDANPTHTFDIGTYTVSLTVSGPTGTGNKTIQNLIKSLQAFTVTASSGPGGTITPAGATIVTIGSSQSYTITPSPNYYLWSLTVDGVNVGNPLNYNFGNVISDHTIEADFAPYPVISASAGVGGMISPTGVTVVSPGGDVTFTITPNPGYQLAQLTVDGTSVAGPSPYPTTYAFNDTWSDHVITAVFSHYLDYYGMQAGNHAESRISVGNRVVGTSTDDLSLDMTSFGHPSYVDLNVSNGTSSKTWYQDYPGGLYMQQMQSSGYTFTFDPALPMAVTPFAAGANWKESSNVTVEGYSGVASISARVYPRVIIGVPAGYFLAWPITYTLEISGRGRTQMTSETEWFAPYFGMVKAKDSEYTIEMTESVVGGGTVTAIPPIVTGIDHKSAARGGQVNITGYQFGGAQGSSVVRIGNFDCEIISWTDNSIECVVPDTAVSGAVTVVTDTWTSNDNVALTVLVPPVPTGVSPSIVQRGSSVQVFGQDFGTAGEQVRIGNTPAKITQWGDGSITCIVPATMPPGVYSITVINSKGRNTLQGALKITR